MAWSGESLVRLSIYGLFNSTMQSVHWASRYLNRLQHLRLCECFCNVPGVTERLIRNNAGTLIDLFLEYGGGDSFVWPGDGTKYLQLRALRCLGWEGSGCCKFLRACPNLLALSVGEVDAATEPLFKTLLECFPLLQRLELRDIEGLRDDDLLQIAQSCPQLEYLRINEVCENIVDVLIALPRLRCFVGYMSESSLLKLAERGHPSLKVLDTGTQFTYQCLLQFTAAMPKLAGLAVSDVIADDALQHCGNLEALRLGEDSVDPAVAKAALMSAAKCCPNLRTLNIEAHNLDECEDELNYVVERCLKLRTVRVWSVCSDDVHITLPRNHVCVDVIDVTDGEHMAIEQWDVECSFE